jgi:hypothetical protein
LNQSCRRFVLTQHTGKDCLNLSTGAKYSKISVLEPASVIVIAVSNIAFVMITAIVSAFVITRFEKKLQGITNSKYS